MSTINRAPPVWFITGSSSGIGLELARQVLRRGFRCVLTARNLDGVRELAAEAVQRALPLRLDVTDATQIEFAVAEAERVFGHIDVLVNNAGYGYYATAEEGDESAVRRMFETNFFGPVMLMQRVLPSMRERRSGAIVSVSSVSSVLPLPGSGYYAATKAALEAVSEAMWRETQPLGVRVLIVEPGPFRTRFLENAQESNIKIADYAATVGVRRAAVIANSGKQAGDPVKAADAIITAIESPSPALRLVLGAQAMTQFRSKLDEMTRDIEAWQALTVGADFS